MAELKDNERAHPGGTAKVDHGMGRQHTKRDDNSGQFKTARRVPFGTLYGPEPDNSQNMSQFARDQIKRNPAE